MNKPFRFMTALFSVIPVLTALLLFGNVAAFEKRSWAEDGEMLSAKAIDAPEATMKYGTEITQAVWKSIMEGSFKVHP
jgi:hypothetical protein